MTAQKRGKNPVLQNLYLLWRASKVLFCLKPFFDCSVSSTELGEQFHQQKNEKFTYGQQFMLTNAIDLKMISFYSTTQLVLTI